ncbi:esterase/lipase family protein [Shimia biformata]|uniref:esterase/lipase family protein n=1 Tax=Shimia biformata TaxID=1294299 RepID=UPI00194F4E36|nr:alpha/beta hydrolase [Shimia biformata]
MNVDPENAQPPSPFLLAAEWRALWEFGAYGLSLPFLSRLPKGDGRPVLVLPGLSAGDMSTLPMRLFLKNRGYAVYGWSLGPNQGYRPGLKELKQKRLKDIYDEHGQKVSLIGWSLGGIYARQLAKAMPDMVRDVITLGSPFKGHPRSSNAWRLYEALAGHTVDEVRVSEDIASAPKVPTTSIFSRTDGVVAWECCIETEGPQCENIGLEGSHCGLGHNPLALTVIADRLSQKDGEWAPFDPKPPVMRAMFSDLHDPIQATH